MRKPKQILDKRLQAFYIIFDEKIPDKSIAFIIGAMQEYAEEYHQSELLKLNKSDVSVTVCGSCLMYLTCNNKDRDKYRCKYYDDEP
jgi:hypothetical protein